MDKIKERFEDTSADFDIESKNGKIYWSKSINPHTEIHRIAHMGIDGYYTEGIETGLTSIVGMTKGLPRYEKFSIRHTLRPDNTWEKTYRFWSLNRQIETDKLEDLLLESLEVDDNVAMFIMYSIEQIRGDFPDWNNPDPEDFRIKRKSQR